jgi:exodeoxyribonuclease VII large subunit
VLSVAELVDELRARIAGGDACVVEGEVANLFRSRLGHVYFDLLDLEREAQLRCVMFASRLPERELRLEEGARVRALGRPDVYPPRGTLQLVAERLWPAGEGALRVALARLQKRLAAEGLFDAEHKRALPVLPRRIGLVTSVQGAAIHDFLTALRARGASLEVLVYDARVQGPGAWRELVRGLHLLASRPGIEVLVLARGGGSFEDLLEFSREELVRAIFALEMPVISAVGHEVDVTLADLVADARAATPTAAAALVAPDARALGAELERLRRRMLAATGVHVARLAQRLASLRRGLIHPRARLREEARRVGALAERLGRAATRAPRRDAARLGALRERLRAPARSLLPVREARVERSAARLLLTMRGARERRAAALGALGARLDALSPLAVLARGYSVTRRLSDGVILRDAADARSGESIDVQLALGALRARIEQRRLG